MRTKDDVNKFPPDKARFLMVLDRKEESQNVLTGRQKEVLSRMTMKNRRADSIRCKTAEYHRDGIKRKLGVKGIAGMERYAIREG